MHKPRNVTKLDKENKKNVAISSHKNDLNVHEYSL